MTIRRIAARPEGAVLELRAGSDQRDEAGGIDGTPAVEFPDNASAAALAMAVGAGGARSQIETTVLLDMDEAQDAMRKAAAATYRPPGS
jgi:hypothetical protein